MTEAEANYILRAVERLETTVKKNHEQTQAQIATIVTDIVVIKNTVSDIKREVFGNGREGLASRTTKLETRLTALDSSMDRAVTTDEVLQAKFRAIEAKILQWSGVVLGINLTIGAIITWAINWEKIMSIFSR